MKWFCLIFSLYLFSLSCLPCNDSEHEHFEQTASTTSFFSPLDTSPEHTHCEDTCSPFCGCQCCSVTSTLSEVEAFAFQKIFIFEQKRFFPDYCLWLKDIVFGIDHPPQLV